MVGFATDMAEKNPQSTSQNTRPHQALGARVARFWRMLATGLCFLCFMTGGLLLTVFIFPILRILPLGKYRKTSWGLALMQRCFAFFMNIMQWLGPIEAFNVSGLEPLEGRGPFLFIANHPALIDVVAILSVLPKCNCIVKNALFNHFFLGGVLRMAQYIPNRNAPELMALCQKSVAAGRSLMIFPEGTRSPLGGLQRFNRGAAQIALRCEIPIVPIVVNCEPATLMKGQPWYDIPHKPVTFSLAFQEPLILDSAIFEKKTFPLQVRALNQFLEDYYKDVLNIRS